MLIKYTCEKLCDMLEKSLSFPQKSLNIFENFLNKNNLKNKMVCTKEIMIEGTAIHKFSWWS